MMNRQMLAILLTAMCVVSACRKRPPPEIDSRLQGEHCISADPLVYFFQQKPHTDAEILTRKKFARAAEAVRVKVDYDGEVTVSGVDGVPHKGRITAAEKEDAALHLTIDWGEAPPTAPVLSGEKAVLEWYEGTWLLKGSDGTSFQLVPSEAPMCVEGDRAWLRDRAAPFKPPPTTMDTEPWAASPPKEWPQLVLTNHAEFKGSSELSGASSFLVTANGETLLATALHLIGNAGGVKPAIPLASLDEKLVEWAAHVRTRREPVVFATKVALRPVLEKNAGDWLLLRTHATGELPSRPLRLRETPVELGERIFLVGCEYREQDCTQGVIGGRVTGRSGHSFRYELDRPVAMPGFSGAPILDAKGRVVGVMSLWFSPFEVAAGELESGGQDATVALGLLQR